MDEYIQKYLEDVLNSIDEVEGYFANRSLRYEQFESDILLRRGVERNVEIMGEALNKILKINPQFALPHARQVVNTRNRIIHEYDGVEPSFLWGLILRHLPQLRKDVQKLIDDDKIDTNGV